MLTSILLPTLNRRDLLMETVKSLFETTKGHDIELVAIIDEDTSSRDALLEYLVQRDDSHIVQFHPSPRGAGFCWNEALRLSHGEILVPAGDDAKFHPEWLDVAKKALAGVGGNHCIGLNDLLNARHDFSTTFLFDRKFCQEVLRGRIAFPTVKYYCQDNMITDLARKANKWVYCPESIIEHVHPAAGKRPADATDASHQEYWTEDITAYEAWKNRGMNIEWESVI